MCTCDLILPPRLREIEDRLHGLKAPSGSQTPALKFKVNELFLVSEPLERLRMGRETNGGLVLSGY